jgi:hypothetical protein
MPSQLSLGASLGRYAHWYSWKWRFHTRHIRALPDFLIVGAQKAGTSSLHAYLAEHPSVIGPFTKEVHYFDDEENYARGLAWYRSHFPFAFATRNRHQTFESSPKYLFFPWASDRIAQNLPNAKIIILLRDPVERAISHYFHNVRHGRETLPILDAFRAEEDRIGREYASSNPYTLGHFSYKARGRYLPQIRRYWQLFPANNVLILSSEFFYGNTQTALSNVLNFLNLDTNVHIDVSRRHNFGSNRTDIPKSARGYLASHFAPYNQALFEALGHSFPWVSRSTSCAQADTRFYDMTSSAS